VWAGMLRGEGVGGWRAARAPRGVRERERERERVRETGGDARKRRDGMHATGGERRNGMERKRGPHSVCTLHAIMALLKYENKNLKNALRDKDG